MAKPFSPPKSSEQVRNVMEKYATSKGWAVSQNSLDLWSEDFYLLWESKQWEGLKYWPALAMKKVLNCVKGYSNIQNNTSREQPTKSKSSGPTLKERMKEYEEKNNYGPS